MKQEISQVKIINATDFKLENVVDDLTNQINSKIKSLKSQGYTIIDVTVQPPFYVDAPMTYRFYQTATIFYTEQEETLDK